jgi:hypothetical protein
MLSWIENASSIAGCSGCYFVRSRQHDRSHRQPEGCVFDRQCPTRQVLDRIADKWTVLIVHSLKTLQN